MTKRKLTKRQYLDKVIANANKLDALQLRIDKIMAQFDVMYEKFDVWAGENLPENVENGKYKHKNKIVSVGRPDDFTTPVNINVYGAPTYNKV